jgi:hypothetical protein
VRIALKSRVLNQMKSGDRVQRDGPAVLGHPHQQGLDHLEGIVAGGGVMPRQKVFEDRVQLARRGRGTEPCRMGQSDQQQQDERNRGEQRVKRERAREEGNVVFVGDLKGALDETRPRSHARSGAG